MEWLKYHSTATPTSCPIWLLGIVPRGSPESSIFTSISPPPYPKENSRHRPGQQQRDAFQAGIDVRGMNGRREKIHDGHKESHGISPQQDPMHQHISPLIR